MIPDNNLEKAIYAIDHNWIHCQLTFETINEQRVWCSKNCTGDFATIGTAVWMEKPEDASWFKLRWE